MFQLHIQGRYNVAFKIGNQTVLDTNGLGGIQLDSDDGALTTSSTFDSRDVAADGVTADAALPRTGGIMTGVISGFESTGIDDNATSTAITIDVNDNVGIGTTAPLSQLQVGGSTAVSADSKLIFGKSTASSQGFLPVIQQSSTGGVSNDLVLAATSGDGAIRMYTGVSSGSGIFGTTSNAERMRIDSAGVVRFKNNIENNSHGLSVAVSNADRDVLECKTSSTGTVGLIHFYNPNGMTGYISTNGSSTAYNTSSDYRLKENVTPMSGATAQTKLLKPCNFDWIAGGNVNGFLAHELAEVVPDAVTGTKDAMKDEEYEVTPAVLDDEGNETTAAVMGTRSVPDMQGIDQSKLVPLLTATIQELIARIEALEAG